MSTFNKNLINSIESDSISKEDYYKILTLLSIIKTNKSKLNELEKEKQYLINELLFIQNKKQNQIYYFAQKELNDSINRICIKYEIEIFKKFLTTQKEIFKIIQKYPSLQQSKSSVQKYKKRLKYLNSQREQIKNEIKENQNELRILKNHFYQKQTLERYTNNLIRFALPKIEKEILKQKFYIDLFTKKGR